ncbi:hypothetical protein [Legionella brunensis]|uniref:Macrodomain effector MavL domain-containing protein n=1 Tax=Legionella brunensis TaxID=29422 RepID=A0A0W0S0P9_9GAMM|nr:hypothetical protein [Legionella brunensis]KTC76978.1 hypothetical protein Lbru_3085 [Legionella brunensis]
MSSNEKIVAVELQITNLQKKIEELTEKFSIVEKEYNDILSRFDSKGFFKKDDLAMVAYGKHRKTEQFVKDDKERKELENKRGFVITTEQGNLNPEEFKRLQELRWIVDPENTAITLFHTKNGQYQTLKKEIEGHKKELEKLTETLSTLVDTSMEEKKEEKKTSQTYRFLLSDISFKKLQQYKLDLLEGKADAGAYLKKKLVDKNLKEMSDEAFIECLVQTKLPTIFAESTPFSGEENWSSTEIALLGDISCSIPTTIYDNGAWSFPKIYEPPFAATLIYVPGALLRAVGEAKPDLDEVTKKGKLDPEAFYRLYERRILPGLLAANENAKITGKKLLVTLPGIGCGQFAGKYGSEIHAQFQTVIERLLTEHGKELSQIQAVWYDNYNKEESTKSINDIDLLVRPLTKGGKPQLCRPEEYGVAYKDCDLVSLVAWDHVSYPGNDYWGGARATDDGVKAAATNTMEVLTGLNGHYDKKRSGFVYSAAPSMTWGQVAKSNQYHLQLQGKMEVHVIKSAATKLESKDVKSEVKSTESEATSSNLEGMGAEKSGNKDIKSTEVKSTESTSSNLEGMDAEKSESKGIKSGTEVKNTESTSSNLEGPFAGKNGSEIDQWLKNKLPKNLNLKESKKAYLNALEEIASNLKPEQKKSLALYILNTPQHFLKQERHFFRTNKYSNETFSVHQLVKTLMQGEQKNGKITIHDEEHGQDHVISRHAK